jgi:sugar phosphate isomerase/epimerase
MLGSPGMFQDYPVEEAMRMLHEFGFNKMEAWKGQMKGFKTSLLRKDFVGAANSLGLTIVGLNAAGEPYFQPFGTDAQLQATLEGLKSDVEYAASLGGEYLLVWEGVRPQGASDQDCMESCLPRLIELFQEALTFAIAHNVRLFIEVHPFTVGIDDRLAIKLYDTLDSPYFGTAYDCCHYGVGRPKDYVDAIRTLGPRIRLIHFCDSDQVSSELHYAPGTGCMDLQAILEAFKEIRFDGLLMLDLYLNPTPIYSGRQSTPRLRQAYEFLGLPD